MKRNIEKGTETQTEKKYLLEFSGGFVIQVSKFHAKSLNNVIRAYLSNYFNALAIDMEVIASYTYLKVKECQFCIFHMKFQWACKSQMLKIATMWSK